MFDVEGVHRYIAGYYKKKDKFGGYPHGEDYNFKKPVPLELLQKLFKIDPQNPDAGTRDLIDCYPIDEKIAKALEPYLERKLDFKKYSFMLECYSAEK